MNRWDLYFVLIGFTQQYDNLVFEIVRLKNAVIANQCAHWCGNPPDRGEMYRQFPYGAGNLAIFGGSRYLVPWGRGIATPVCALARNDSMILAFQLLIGIVNC